MKTLYSVGLVLALIPLAGCASASHQVSLAPVGPSEAKVGAPGSSGALVVYTAIDPNAHFNDLPYRVFYTDYKIYSSAGALLTTIQNNNRNSLEGPKTVDLPPGSYRVVAQANGFGEVTVPVVIAANRTTRVHLDGEGAWTKSAALQHSNPVRLPDGQIVGWRAETANGASLDTEGNARTTASTPVRYHHEVVPEPGTDGTQFLQLVPDTNP